MLIVLVKTPGEQDFVDAFHHETITLGTADDNDLVLTSGARHQAALHIADGAFVIEWLVAPSLESGDLLMIDSQTMKLKHHRIGLELFDDPTEIRMLTAVGRGDDDARSVYADWLEERGRSTCADLLRLQLAMVAHAPGSPELAVLAERGFALNSRVQSGWGAFVARPAIDIGDERLTIRVGPPRGARRIEDSAMFQICVGDQPVTPVAEIASDVLLNELEGDAARRFPELVFPDRDGPENHRRAISYAGHGARYRWLRWGSCLERVQAFAFTDGADVVLTFGSFDHGEILATRLPLADLRERLARVREIVLA